MLSKEQITILSNVGQWFVRQPFLLYGIYLFIIGTLTYLVGVILVIPRYLTGPYSLFTPISETLVWYSGFPVFLGIIFSLLDLLILFSSKRQKNYLRNDTCDDPKITVALTAYNDEKSISEAVRDFVKNSNVSRVIVVDNNSTDNTAQIAKKAGAIVFNENNQGYGQCVFRCLQEASNYKDTKYVVLCEGDRTFRSQDIQKLLSYLPHADIINGTRTVEILREHKTQLSTFIFYGNLFVGKLLEAKHLGKATITDVGTTYRLMRSETIKRLLPLLNKQINLEFNAHLIDTALANNYTYLECPITFYSRVGESKGGNKDNLQALKVGLKMIYGITFGWNN